MINRFFLLACLISSILFVNAMDNNWKEEDEYIEKECNCFIKEEKKIKKLLEYSKKSTDSDEIKVKKLEEKSREIFSKPFIDIKSLKEHSEKLLTKVFGNLKLEEKEIFSSVNYNDNENSIVAEALYVSKNKQSCEKFCVMVVKYLDKQNFDIRVRQMEPFSFQLPWKAHESSVNMLKAKISVYEKKLKQ